MSERESRELFEVEVIEWSDLTLDREGKIPFPVPSAPLPSKPVDASSPEENGL